MQVDEARRDPGAFRVDDLRAPRVEPGADLEDPPVLGQQVALLLATGGGIQDPSTPHQDPGHDGVPPLPSSGAMPDRPRLPAIR